MECNDIGFPRDLFQGYKAGIRFRQLARRVIAQHTHAFPFGHGRHQPPHMPDTDNTQRLSRHAGTVDAFHVFQHCLHILADTIGIASGCIGPCYALPSAIGRIDMVVSDGCRRDEADSRTIKQGGIAADTRPNDQRIRIAHKRRCERCRIGINDFGKRLQHPVDKRNKTIYDNFHKIMEKRLRANVSGRKSTDYFLILRQIIQLIHGRLHRFRFVSFVHKARAMPAG